MACEPAGERRQPRGADAEEGPRRENTEEVTHVVRLSVSSDMTWIIAKDPGSRATPDPSREWTVAGGAAPPPRHLTTTAARVTPDAPPPPTHHSTPPTPTADIGA